MRAHSLQKAPLKVSAVTVLAVAAVVATSASEPGTVAAKAAASAKNGQIAFRRFFDSAHRRGAIFLVSPDGTGERQITQPPADAIDAQFGPPSIAPDGSKVLFTRTQAGTDELWTVDVDDGHEQRISPMPRFDHPVGHQANQQNANGVYSPDGRRIAFGRADPPLRKNNLATSLNTMAADGTHLRRVINFGYHGDVGRIAWAPNGKRIVYEAARFGNSRPAHALFVVAARGGRPRRISPWRAVEFNTLDWSPDGSRLLIQTLPLDSDFGGDYYTIRPDGSGLRRLTHFGPKTTTGSARWSPDGKSIVFANVGIGGNDDIYVMRANGSAVTPVTRTPTWESAAAWGRAR